MHFKFERISFLTLQNTKEVSISSKFLYDTILFYVLFLALVLLQVPYAFLCKRAYTKQKPTGVNFNWPRLLIEFLLHGSKALLLLFITIEN